MYLDEHLLVRILDERARSISPNDPANYCRLETIVEKFGEEIAPYAMGMTANLAAAFWKLTG